MNVQTQQAPDPVRVDHDLRTELRETIAEHLSMAGLQINLAHLYTAAGDDKGLEYSLRRYVAYTKAALATFNDLAKRNIPGGDE